MASAPIVANFTLNQNKLRLFRVQMLVECFDRA